MPLELPNSDVAMAKINLEWWRSFNDPVLDDLINEGLKNNQDLVLANARIEEAQAYYQQKVGRFAPQIDGNFGASRGHASSDISPSSASTQNIYQGSLMLRWEFDLWGQMAQNKQASFAQLEAQSYIRDGAYLSLSAQIAQTYFNILSLQDKLDIIKKTTLLRQQTLNLRKKRLQLGLSSELEVRQAESELNQALLLKPELESYIITQKNNLNVLLGRSPKEMQANPLLFSERLSEYNLSVPSNLSSELILRRSDIASKEAELRAANAQIGVARSAYFPVISLTGTLGTSSGALKNLLTSGASLWNLVGSIVTPIFNLNQTSSQVNIATSKQKQALSQYTKTIQQAFSDVSTALSQQESASSILNIQKNNIQTISRTVELSRKRYAHGYIGHLELIDAERNLLQSQLAFTDAKLAKINTLIQLYKSLGGGWEKPTIIIENRQL
jgi:multidrug efflux system outer membrane protein